MSGPDRAPRSWFAQLVPVALRPWLGAVMISFSAVWVRFADVEPARSAMLRGAYALPVLIAVVAIRLGRSRQTADGAVAGPVPWRRWVLPGAVVAGILLGIDFVAWHESIAIIGAGLGTVLPNLQVVFVGVAGVVLFRERPRHSFWAALPLVLVGIWLLGAVGRPIVDGGSVALGVVYGLIAAITYAGCLVLLRFTRARAVGADPVAVLLSLTFGSLLVTVPVAVVEGVAGPAGWPADGWLVVLALGSQVIGWLLLTSSIHVLPAAATSVALLLQPVLALGWGALLLSEPLGRAQLSGAAIVLVGVGLAHHGARGAAVTATSPAVTRGPPRGPVTQRSRTRR